MDEGEQRAMLVDFERNRQMLVGLSSQKQQLSMQLDITNVALEELKNTKEKMVWKAVGNLLVPKSTEEMEKELKERKESFELRMKTFEKQEETIIKKLNSIKSKIEGKDKVSEEAETKVSEEKEEKHSKKKK